MARVKRGVNVHLKHKKLLKKTKGFWGRRKNTIRIATQAINKSLQYSYISRRLKKRNFKKSWIKQLNINFNLYNLPYRYTIYILNKINLFYSRKFLSIITYKNKEMFLVLIDIIKIINCLEN